ncbi:MAG TPA: Rv2578c family radical SAM protein [Rugosimonospora sp.]|nr:Rv2578c family radical SAM protein [Rugosimonospora sp.]
MRWEGLSNSAETGTNDDSTEWSRAAPLPLALPGAVARTFNTPGFAGMTFYEIQAKSIINRVPAQSRVPFQWTINPYRGCSHACTYCLAADTPVLMANGASRAIADLRVGDAIYGTVPVGNRRRYVMTEVRDHWSSVRPAYRVTLANGTELVSSADHRFLTAHGWRHVSGEGGGPDGHSPLTTEDRLVTTLGPQQVEAVEPLGVDVTLYDISTGTGDFIANGVISHNCFARNTHTYLDLDSGHDFDSRIVVKLNAGALLRRELAAPRWRGGHIAMGTNVDCYQRAEGRYRLMRDILAALRDFANPFSILTKGTLILRDLDLLREAARVTSVSVSFSVGFVDEELWRTVEPGTPSPRRRLDVVRQLSDAGFEVGVLMAPVLPGLTDDDESIDATVSAIAAAGAVSATPLPLHLRTGAREWYLSWLSRTRPDLLPRYRELFARGAYSPAAYQRELTERVHAAARRHRIPASMPGQARRVAPQPKPAEPVQLTLM